MLGIIILACFKPTDPEWLFITGADIGHASAASTNISNMAIAVPVVQTNTATALPASLTQVQKKGLDAARLKQTYKKIAKALHPDQCRLDGAGPAFARVQSAYADLLKTLPDEAAP